jgi:hypothetical protein
VRTLEYFKKVFFFALEKIKSCPKSSLLMAVWIFFSAALTAQNSPELKIHIINVAQDTSLLLCGLLMRLSN